MLGLKRLSWLGIPALLALAGLLARPIWDITVQDYWKDFAAPFLHKHVGSWATGALDRIGPFWLGAGSAFLLCLTWRQIAVWLKTKLAEKGSESGNTLFGQGQISLHGLDGGRIWSMHFEAPRAYRDVVFRVEWRSMSREAPRYSDWQRKTLLTLSHVGQGEGVNVTLTAYQMKSAQDGYYYWDLPESKDGRSVYDVPSSFSQARAVVSYNIDGAGSEIALKFIILDRDGDGNSTPKFINEGLFRFSGREEPHVIL